MNFICVSFDRSEEYRDFILSHDNAVKTERAAWVETAKNGSHIIPYSESAPQDEPDRDSVVYFEFVDEGNNIYVDFFNRDTYEWIESFKFYDKDLAWTISWDKYFDELLRGGLKS